MTERTRPRAATVDGLITSVQVTVVQVGQMFQNSQSVETVDTCLQYLADGIQKLERVQTLAQGIDAYQELINECKLMLAEFQSIRLQLPKPRKRNFAAPRIREKATGRPKAQIPAETIDFYLSEGYTIPRIASKLGVHRNTITKRMRTYHKSVKMTYQAISDLDLDEKVSAIVQHNTNIGYRQARSALLKDGCKVTFDRVRKSLLRINPAACALRTAKRIKRRQYISRGPNETWHIDGNHKLVKWKFVIHGCVDGFSRNIIYLKVAGNNKADTVLGFFKDGVREWSLPTRLVSDAGGENTRVHEWMYRQGMHPFVTKSTNNVRIERLWVDKFLSATSPYYDLFAQMEREECLNRLSNVQMWALHYVFMPLIQQSLDDFRDMYNRHPMRTEHNKTPRQLFFDGVMDQAEDPTPGVSRFIRQMQDIDAGNYVDLDEDGTIEVPHLGLKRSQVHVTSITCPLTQGQLANLNEQIDPLRDSQDGIGRDVYTSVMHFLARLGL